MLHSDWVKQRGHHEFMYVCIVYIFKMASEKVNLGGGVHFQLRIIFCTGYPD